jgi:hypothetical protein
MSHETSQTRRALRRETELGPDYVAKLPVAYFELVPVEGDASSQTEHQSVVTTEKIGPAYAGQIERTIIKE